MLTLLLICLLSQAPISNEITVEQVLRPTKESLERATLALSAPEFAVREQASNYLWYCGRRAENALQDVIGRGDFEARIRAKEILDAIQKGIVPTIGDARLRGVVLCRMGNWREGREALANANALNLLKDLAEESNREARFAADQRNSEVLKHLPEADKAKFAAQTAQAIARHEALERRDWAALYRWAEKIEQGWLRGTTLRLALLPELGRQDETPAVLSEMRARVASEPVMCGKAAGELILAARPDDALALNMEYSRISAMQMLADDLRFREGFAAVGITLPLRDPDTWMEKLWADQVGREAKDIYWPGRVGQAAFVARTAARLGERDVAIRFMNYASELAESNPGGNSLASIWEDELAMGLAERAWRHFGESLKDKKAEERNAALCWQHREAAGAWWDFLRAAQPKAPIDDVARTVVSLLDPRKSNAFSEGQVRTFIANLCQHAAELDADGRADAWQAAAETAEIHKLTELGNEIWSQLEEQKPSAASALALADYFAAKERWDDAAKSYGRAWSRDRTLLFALILQAKSLEKSGRHEEAIRARLVAEVWPTGNDNERMQIPFRLQLRGQMTDAHEQFALARRIVQHPYEWVWIFLSQADHQAASAPGEAAKTWNLVRFMCFGDGMILTGDEVKGLYCGHEELVQRIHHYKAMSLIEARDFEAALSEATVAEAAQPAGKLLPLEVIARFDAAGAREHGDVVFGKMWSRRQRVLDDFPKAGEFHEELAVIGAACSRKLNESLVHAERAISLRPKQVSSLLALAQVHWARGEVDAARMHLAEASAIEPSSPDIAKLKQKMRDWPQ